MYHFDFVLISDPLHLTLCSLDFFNTSSIIILRRNHLKPNLAITFIIFMISVHKLPTTTACYVHYQDFSIKPYVDVMYYVLYTHFNSRVKERSQTLSEPSKYYLVGPTALFTQSTLKHTVLTLTRRMQELEYCCYMDNGCSSTWEIRQ